MVERRIVVEPMTVEYSGLFNVSELYKMIANWITEKSYLKHDMRNFEQVLETGKHIEYVAEPYKKITDYAKYVINITLTMENVKEVVVEKSGSKVRLNQGDVKVELSGFLELDYEHRWEKKPLFYFLRAIFDQFIFKVNTEKFEQGLAEEVNHLHTTTKAFLNLYRH